MNSTTPSAPPCHGSRRAGGTRLPRLAASCLALAALITLAAPALAQDTAPRAPACRVAFDLGSSGIRAGASTSEQTAKRELDALGPLWAGQGIAAIAPATAVALRDLPVQAGFAADCARVGGGFSAWRLALAQDPASLVDALRRIRAESGVAVLVVPPEQEGAYAYFAAKKVLGDRLTTSHVLDIGGGSLQVAGERQTLAAALGQKSWHRLLCTYLRDTSAVPCALQPLDTRDLTRARALIAVRLAGQLAAQPLPATTTMTAVSRPVSRGVQPAVQKLAGQPADRRTPLLRSEVHSAIEQLAPLDLAATAERTQSAASHAAYLLSDLILVEGLMRLTADGRLPVAEADFTNIPGLLADERAYAWAERYGCYLDRLRESGIAAYASDPTTCR
jgi:hypothetical protein